MKKILLFVCGMLLSVVAYAADVTLTVVITSDNVTALKAGFLNQYPKTNSGLSDKQWIQYCMGVWLLRQANEGLDEIAKDAVEKLNNNAIQTNQ